MTFRTNRYHPLPALLVALCAALFLTAGAASAADRTWDNGAGDFNFNNAVNWSDDTAPDATDRALINLDGDYTVNVTAASTVGALVVGGASGTQRLTIFGGVTLTINGQAGASSVATGDVFTVDGALNTSAPATLTVDGTFNSNGTLALAGGLTVNGTVNLNSGTLSGAGAQIVASGGTMNWSGGTLGATVALENTTIATGATLNLLTGGTRSLDMRTLTNNGTVNWTGLGYLQAYNGATLNNESGGLIDVTFSGSDSYLLWGNVGARPTLNNKSGATLRKRTGSEHLFLQDVTFNNDGTVDAQNGILDVAQSSVGGASGTSTGTFNAAAGATINFSSNPHTLNGASFTGAGASTVTASTVTLSGTATVASGANLTLDSVGVLTGPGNLQVNGTLNWNSGTMSGAGTTTLAAAATLNLATSNNKLLDTRTLINNGTINWTGLGYLHAIDGASVNNESGGLIDATFSGGDSYLYWGNAGANPTFNNKSGATLRKRTGTGSLFFQDANFNNDGTVDAQDGTIDVAQFAAGGASGTSTGSFNAAAGATINFSSNPHTLNGASFTGAGTSAIIASTVTINGIVIIDTGAKLNLNGGTVTGTGAISGAGSFNWTSGKMSGAGITTVAAGATLNLLSSSTKFLDGHTLTNNGTINWMSLGYLQANNGGILNNESGGLLDATFSGDSIFYWGSVGANPTFNNKSGATLRKRTGSGNLIFQDVSIYHSGTVDAQNGTVDLASLAAGGATLTLGSGSTFMGAGLSRANGNSVVLNSAITISSGANFEFASGTLTGTGSINGAGSFNWSGGTMSGAGATTVATGAALNLNSTNVKTLDGHTLTNSGTVNWNNDGWLAANNGAVFNNESGALLDVVFPNTAYFEWSNAGANSTFNNKSGATLRKRTGTGSLFFRDANFNNDGTVDAQDGTIDVARNSIGGASGASTGAFNAAAGATINFGGTPHALNGVNFTGAGTSTITLSTVTLSGTTTVASGANLTLDSIGVLIGPGNLQVNGTLNWNGGTMSGAGTTTLAAAATLNLATGSNKFLDTRTLTNNGTINWTGLGYLQANNGAIVNNESGALLDATFSGGDSYLYWGNTGARPTFNNKSGATLRKRTGSGNLIFQDVMVNNGGTVDAQNGTIDLANASVGGATLTLGSGSTFAGAGLSRANGNSVVFNSAITINSGARFELASGTLTGTGSINGPGSFNWTGGKMSGSGITTVAAGATLNLNTTNVKILDGHTLTNSGTVNWNNDGWLAANNGAGFNNESGALLDVVFSNTAYFYWGSVGARPTLNNKSGATLRKRTNTGTLFCQDVLFTNDGTINVQSGTIALNNSSGGGSFSNFASNKGTLTGGTYILKGTFKFPGADIVTNEADITLDGAASQLLDTNTGLDALVSFKANAAAGSFTIQNGRNLSIATSGFSNAGSVTIGPDSTFTVSGAGKNYTQSGTTDLNGGTLTTTATGKVNLVGGTLVGTGTVNSTLQNAATISPGHSPGIITISTDYTQIGTLNVEIGGTNAATPAYDQLKVTGAVTLGGALNLSLINDFKPTSNNQFTIISNSGSDPVAGTFTGLPQGAMITLGGKAFLLDYAGGDGNDVTLTIAPSLRINDVTVTEGNSGTTNATFSVKLSFVSLQTVTVQYATADGTATAGSDYTAVNGTLSFAPGETSKTFIVPINGDTLDEPKQETFKVILSSPDAAFIQDGQGVGTITDDDLTPIFSINDVTVTEGNVGTVDAVFTINLSAPSGRTVTLTYKTADVTATAGSDYVAHPSTTLTYLPGQISKTVMVKVNGDTIDEFNETFQVVLQSATFAGIPDTKGVCTISDDDPLPVVSISDVPALTEGDSGSKNALFTVTLTGLTQRTVTVDYATHDGTALAGSDYLAKTGTITFLPGQTSKTLPIAVLGDTLSEAAETFKVNLTGATFVTAGDNQGIGTITDNDPLPRLSINDVTKAEGPAQGAPASTTSFTFTVTLSAASGQTVTVNYATADGTAKRPGDYAIKSGTLTFAPGETTKTIVVSVLGDAIAEADETFFVNLSAPSGATLFDPQGVATIQNDDVSA